jgi:prephenate dehydrogenase
MKRKIVIVGLGLIGGSLARAFQKYAGCPVAGIDRDPAVVQAALRCGAIGKAGTEKDIQEADILYLCLYPQADVQFVREHLSSIRPGCVVTDTCGIKSWICPRLSGLAAKRGFAFVGGHPMAGKEKSGFSASDADLFRGASYILVPCGAPRETVNLLRNISAELGFGSAVETTPEEHDRIIAFTSQLPHVLACAYVKSPQCLKHRGFSAGSYRDVSRVANINETMWTELFLENREALVGELDTLTKHIREIRDAVDTRDADTLRRLLREGRLIKEKLGE